MKLITWIVALLNRKWQREFEREFDEMVAEAENVKDEELCHLAAAQPTHLPAFSTGFKPRAKRNWRNKGKNPKYIRG